MLIPLSLKAELLTVLMGKLMGNASLRLMICGKVVSVGAETSMHFLRSSFVSSSTGTPLGAPKLFSHDISGASFSNCS